MPDSVDLGTKEFCVACFHKDAVRSVECCGDCENTPKATDGSGWLFCEFYRRLMRPDQCRFGGT